MRAESGAIRVATFPARHPFLAAVRPDDVRIVAPPVEPGAPEWTPHPWWDPAALAAAPDFDLAHVHFGFDHVPPPVLTAWVEALRQRRAGLVITVHDLRNPHHATPDRHDAQLDVLVPAADAVLTLTPGAAAAVAERWGRRAEVLAHPTLLPEAPPDRPAAPGRPRVGIHLKSLRTNVVDPAAVVLAAASGAVRAGAGLVVDLHPEVAERPELAAVRAAAERGELTVSVHPRFDDDALIRYLQGLAVSVLPQRFGTHSGWLELCRDVGTRVVAPDCGRYAEQWPQLSGFGHNERTGLDADGLAAAVAAAVAAGPLAPAERGARLAERDRVRAGHREVYRRVLATARPGPPAVDTSGDRRPPEDSP